jgi:hypothetical protein
MALVVNAAAVPLQRIQQMVLVVRGRRVMTDADLAALYGVATRALNQAVRRNAQRFPIDFVFRLTRTEKTEVITLCDHLQALKYSPSLPLAFTEHGAIMAASVLNAPRAMEVSVYVVRAFVKLRETLASNRELSRRLAALEKKYDAQFRVVFDAIRELMVPPILPKKRIGFGADER